MHFTLDLGSDLSVWALGGSSGAPVHQVPGSKCVPLCHMLLEEKHGQSMRARGCAAAGAAASDFRYGSRM